MLVHGIGCVCLIVSQSSRKMNHDEDRMSLSKVGTPSTRKKTNVIKTLFKTPNAKRELWRCWCSPTRWYITQTWRRDSPRRFQGLEAQNDIVNDNVNENDNDSFFGSGTKEFFVIARKTLGLGWPWPWQYHINHIYLPRRWWTSAQTPVRSTGSTRQTANWFVLLWKHTPHWNYLLFSVPSW